MADDQVHKQAFLIRNLSTSQVTLYPTKAQIVRDINNVNLRPGANEITVYGITPTAEESSIKVDGRGAATITDMMVDLVPNKQAYEDVYPETDDDADDPPPPDVKAKDASNEEIDALTHEIAVVDQEMKHLSEELGSSSAQLQILDKYKNTVEERTPSDLPKFIHVYREERNKAFLLLNESQSRIEAKLARRQELIERQAKATHALRMQTKKADKQKKLEAERKARVQKEKADAKLRLTEERSHFWPKKVYRLVISLDAGIETPVSSRRGSVESLSTLKQDTPPVDPSEISLSVSYVSSAASWAPRYDLSLHTSNATGTIIYRAEYYNATSETWKDAKVSLSTSEAAFQGLGRPIPLMKPWHLKLAHGSYNVSNILMSNQEHDHRVYAQAGELAKASEPRSHLFGLPATMTGDTGLSLQRPKPIEMSQQPQVNRSMQAQQVMQCYHAPGQASQQPDRSMEIPRAAPAPPPRGGAMHKMRHSATASSQYEDEKEGGADSYSPDDIHDLPSLTTEEATWAEEGLTFTYDVGVRTITPSFTKRRYRIVSVNVKNVHQSHLLVPKLQAAAFLKARIPNSSSISLLRGMADITLDGSFLGNTTIPRCSAGDNFSLSLGIDPSVNVNYGKPVMRRMKEGGLFFSQKEGSYTFSRTCTILNTKTKRAIEGLMLDQVPISDDERLKVWIQKPANIHAEGTYTSDGEGGTRDGRPEPKWGKARVTKKAKGEICWDFRIEPSKGAKFVLEYETKFPGGESVIGFTVPLLK